MYIFLKFKINLKLKEPSVIFRQVRKVLTCLIDHTTEQPEMPLWVYEKVETTKFITKNCSVYNIFRLDLQVHQIWSACIVKLNHRIIEHPKLRGTHKIIVSKYCLHTKPPQNQNIYLRALSRYLLNSGKISAMIISLGNLFHYVSYLSVKKLLLIFNMNLPSPPERIL